MTALRKSQTVSSLLLPNLSRQKRFFNMLDANEKLPEEKFLLRGNTPIASPIFFL
jgi:hypothetical protein